MDIIKFFINQKKFALVLTALMIFFGLLSLNQIQREQFPNVDFEVMFINTSYPNSSPLDVEQDVTNLIEDKLKSISGIEFYTSLSKEGLSRITVQISQDGEDVQQVKQDIRSEVTSITDFPEDVTPSIFEQKTSRAEILRVNLSGSYNMFDLEQIAKNLKDKIEQVEGVSEVDEDGNVDTEIKIYLDLDLLKKYRLSLADLIGAIRNRNYRYTAGDNNNPTDNANIVVLENFSNSEDIGELIVKANFDGDIIYLKDVAEILIEPTEISDILRVNGKTGYELKVRKSLSADIIDTVDEIKQVVASFQENYDEKLDIFYTNDQSKFVRNRLNIVFKNAIIGFVSVIIVLGIFLSIKTAFWVSVGITSVLLGTIMLLLVFGETINLISLAAIILVLGLVVDDSIIISESIEHEKERDNSSMGVNKGYKRVIKPVITTITTTIIAISSMFFMQGIMGKFIYIIPVVIIFALILSFVEVTFALPAHLNNNKVSKPKRWFRFVEKLFATFIYKILRVRYLVIFIFLAVAASSFYFAFTSMKFVLFPASGSDIINVRLKTDNTFDLLKTSDVSLNVEEAIIDNLGENLEFISSDVGGSSPNRSAIDVRLISVVEREKKAPQIVEELKAATKDIANIEKLDFSIRRPGPPQGDDVEVVLISNNDIQREAASMAVQNLLTSLDGVSDIELDNDEGKKRIRVVFDFDSMARLGVNFSDVKDVLNASFSGVKVADTRRGNIDIDYKIFLGKDSKISILDEISVTNNRGRLIPLNDLISIEEIDGESDYNHYKGKRSITVSASLDDKVIDALSVTSQIKNLIEDDSNYAEVLLMFEGGSKDSEESLKSFGVAFIFAIVVIYLLLIVLFNSYSQPLIILSAVPFAFIGVIWAFYLHAEPLSFFTLLGSLALIGVIVNDSLVMVTHLNNIKMGKTNADDLRTWVAQGSKDRLRAVVLTSITTLVGVIPLAYGIGGVDIFLQPMVLALGYGLLFGTIITLILTPSLYMMNYEINAFFARIIKNIRNKFANEAK